MKTENQFNDLTNKKLEARFSEYIPGILERGIIYISHTYLTSSHLCPCGCGSETVIPFVYNEKDNQDSSKWVFSDSITFSPSIFNRICNSHYYIDNCMIKWCW